MTRRILVVDDEPTILLTVKAILEMNGYEVATAASSAEAKLKLGAGTYELVITDLRMEHERAGFDVLRFAKEQGYPPAVLILTGCPDLGKDWKEQGAEGLLTKPTNTPELLDYIENLVAGQQITARPGKKPLIILKPSEAAS